MKGIYNSMPETNHAPTVYIVVGILQLQFVAQVNALSHVKALDLTSVVCEIYVQCQIWLFSIFPRISCFAVTWFRYFLNDPERV